MERDAKVQKTIEEIEKGLELIGLSGVEDKLQVTPFPRIYYYYYFSGLH